MIQTYSRDGLPEVKHFKSESIDAGMRVRVQETTGLSRNRAQRQQQLTQLFQMGVITDPETFAELLEVPSSTFTPALAHDIRLARNENLVLAEGTPIVPTSWDNHAIHLREHNNFRKSSEYLTLPDAAKLAFEHHCDGHEVLEIQEIQKFAMKQIMMQGGAVGVPMGEGGESSESGPSG
jgi:hypothetical protein